MNAESSERMKDLAGLGLSRIDAVFEIADSHHVGFGTGHGKTHLFLALGRSSLYLIGFGAREHGRAHQVRIVEQPLGHDSLSAGATPFQPTKPTATELVDAGVTCAGVALDVAGVSLAVGLAAGPVGILVAVGSVVVSSLQCGIRVETLIAHQAGRPGFFEDDPTGKTGRVVIDAIDVILGVVQLRSTARAASKLARGGSRAGHVARLLLYELPNFALTSDNLLGNHGSLYDSVELMQFLAAHVERRSEPTLMSTPATGFDPFPNVDACFDVLQVND